MTRQSYNIKESLNRALEMLKGNALASEQPNTQQGEVLSWNQALSDIVEILVDGLPGENAELPSALVASVAEANAESTNVVALTPLSHSWIHEYGGIYIETGTVEQSLTQDTWAKITGAFQNYTEDSGGEIFCDWNDDRIVINETGVFLLSYQLSVLTPDGGEQTLQLQVFSSGTAQGQTRSEMQFNASGTCTVMSAFAPVNVLVTGTPLDIRARPDASITVKAKAGQLLVQRMVG